LVNEQLYLAKAVQSIVQEILLFSWQGKRLYIGIYRKTTI